MKCKKCRKTIPDGSKFCNHCGAPISAKKKLYRRPDGLYEKIMMIDGKRVAFRAQKEVDVFKKIREYENNRAIKEKHGELFSVVAEMWKSEHWEILSPTTQKGYQCAFKELKEYFAKDYIKQITHKDINQYLKQLPKSYARKTCATRLDILNMIFKFAIVEDLCGSNPCEYVTVPKGHGSKKRRAPTDKEISVIKKSFGILYKGWDIGLLAVFILYTGCRKGEALALQFRDVNRKEKRIKINKSIYYEHNEGKIKEPKTEAGKREVIIPDALMVLLPNGKPNDYIFSPTPSTPVRDHFFRKAWELWQSVTGLGLTAHQLRHGYATILLEADIAAKDAQVLLGHADISTTLNIYTDINDNRKRKTQIKLNEYLQ